MNFKQWKVLKKSSVQWNTDNVKIEDAYSISRNKRLLFLQKLKWEKGHDVEENKTVFVRNLSFGSDEEDLRDMMDQNFGKVLFAKLVIDKVTEHPKGTAFVKFASEESAQKCIEASEGQDGLWLDNRQFYAALALKPGDAKVILHNFLPFRFYVKSIIDFW